MSHPDLFDVAIVGYGPTGAVAAGLLGQHGIRTWVCDRQHGVYDKPRAIALDHEIMRVFQELHIAQALQPHMEPFTNSEFFGVDGQLIKCMSTIAPPYPLGYAPSIVFSQPPLEALLRERVAALPSVTVALGQSVIDLSQDEKAATLTVQDENGQRQQVRARYVIGCDGASSFVRQKTGLPLDDLGFDEPWLVVDLLVNDSGLAKLPRTSVQFCEPQRPTTLVIGPGRHRRWELAINPGEDPQQLATPEGVWSLLSRWLTPQDATLWRQASYRFHALVAQRWRQGRIFLAGDAAHQQPPFLGQGMCQGIRDAANLCWKLQAVLQHHASDNLLDTYGDERQQHVRELTTRIKGIGQLVGERDPAKARARDAKLLAECGGVVQPTPRQNVQPALSKGLLSDAGRGPVGTLFPQPWLSGDTAPCRMDERWGTGWRLVLCAAAPPEASAATVTFNAMPLQVCQLGQSGFVETEGVVSNWLQTHQAMAVVVRPDHYVYAMATDPEQLHSQLIQLQQALRPA